MYRRRLLDAGISPEAVDKIDAETATAIDAATETARNSSPPPIDIAHIDVWADGSSEWRN
jgi:TPP-dependent pyruvate/acetoin dehydrogenase alpha subunit